MYHISYAGISWRRYAVLGVSIPGNVDTLLYNKILEIVDVRNHSKPKFCSTLRKLTKALRDASC